MPSNTHAVALAVKDEGELLALEYSLAAAGISFVAVREPDMGGALTCIGLTPQPRTKLIRKILGRLSLLK